MEIPYEPARSWTLPGVVPSEWLAINNYSICLHCSTLVSTSRLSSHINICSHASLQPSPSASDNPGVALSSSQLPSFDEIFSTFCPTLKHIPFHDRQSFGRVFLNCLLSILHDGSSHSWQRFLMLPKCVLASSKRGGRHHKHIHQSASCVIFGRQVKKFNYGIKQRGMQLNQVSRAFPHLN